MASGECVTIQGPSGSGKSLLLRAIVDLDPNDGDVSLDEIARNKVPADEWRRLVAMVPAESGWWSDLVGDHFEPDNDPVALLDAIGLPDALAWKVDRLSSGERHRLAIARAIANRPAAILLDEPTATLDSAATQLVEAVLMQECERGVAMIVVTHDPAQAERLSERHYMMAQGRLTPDQEILS